MKAINTAVEAEQKIDDITALIEKLTAVIERETRAGARGSNPHRLRS